MINTITHWIFGDIEHLDPDEASAIMAIVMTPVVIGLTLSI